jgi:hypothetical protein
MSTLPTKLAIISYRSGMSGDVLAEYADDKIRFCENSGIKTFVITSLDSNLKENTNLKIFRTPSVSKIDFDFEISNLKLNQSAIPMWTKFYKIIPNTFGRIFDFIYKLVNDKHGYARWSWAINAFFVGIIIRVGFGVRHFYAVGSVTAYLTGLALRFTAKINLYIEVPDPIIGREMHRTKLKLKLIKSLEKLLILNSRKYILITSASYKDALSRYPEVQNKISFYYPRAWDFKIRRSNSRTKGIKIVHLGSLYGNRNLDNFFEALDRLYKKDVFRHGEIEVFNIGTSTCENSEEYLLRPDFKLMATRDRKFALEMAIDSDYLLLLQHTDTRSVETIPYKLYDYLNLNVPILGLINNSEIGQILSSTGVHLLADVNDVSSIESLLLRIHTRSIERPAALDVDNQAIGIGVNFESIFD